MLWSLRYSEILSISLIHGLFNDSSGLLQNFFTIFSVYSQNFYKIYKVRLNFFENSPKAWEGQLGRRFLIYCWKPIFSEILIMRRNLYFELALTEWLTGHNCLVPTQHKCNHLLVHTEVARPSESVGVIGP